MKWKLVLGQKTLVLYRGAHLVHWEKVCLTQNPTSQNLPLLLISYLKFYGDFLIQTHLFSQNREKYHFWGKLVKMEQNSI